MKSWQEVWHDGIAPSLPTCGLEALHAALVNDDFRLIQGATTLPPPIDGVQSWPVEAACVIGFSGWQGQGLESVEEGEEVFAFGCGQADQRLGATGARPWVLKWYDRTARAGSPPRLLCGV